MEDQKNMQKPLILISNDDGINAYGIRHLVDLMKTLGEVVVIAPDSPQSGMGHAITIGNTLRLNESHLFEDVKAYQCSGTPADCVKLAKGYVLDRKPDLVVSGINHGSNTSISVIYSGTMSAALEGAIEDIPSIGFSVCDYSLEADFSHADEHVIKISQQVLKTGLPKGVALNVNFPAKREKEPIKGIKICRQTRAKWQEEFDRRIDPAGRQYFWLTGSFVNQDKGEDIDQWAIDHNYTSVVPVSFDMTAYHAIGTLNKEWDI